MKKRSRRGTKWMRAFSTSQIAHNGYASLSIFWPYRNNLHIAYFTAMMNGSNRYAGWMNNQPLAPISPIIRTDFATGGTIHTTDNETIRRSKKGLTPGHEYFIGLEHKTFPLTKRETNVQ